MAPEPRPARWYTIAPPLTDALVAFRNSPVQLLYIRMVLGLRQDLSNEAALPCQANAFRAALGFNAVAQVPLRRARGDASVLKL